MSNIIKKPEILAPIRNWASLEACKNYANAVYFGCADLSMRARSNNIKLSELNRFVKKCHRYNIRAYLALNSVIYNGDIEKVEKIIKAAKKAQVDALIVWDPAVIGLAKKHKMEFHISTQANISNWKSAKFYQDLGASRLILAREITLKQIKEIISKVDIKIETFVHGAMCMAISGRCILSASLYNKSANCGSCAQPCREKWIIKSENGKILDIYGKYFFSSKDLCMIEHIDKLIKAGISAFKIEGRRRDPKYIEITSKCYREAVDAYYNNEYSQSKILNWKNNLINVYNRGFTTGFYFGDPKKEGITFDHTDNVSLIKKLYIGKALHYFTKAKVATIRLSHRGIKIGDKITFDGNKTYFDQIIKSLEIENKPFKVGKKGEEAAIKVDKRVRKNDNVYIYQ